MANRCADWWIRGRRVKRGGVTEAASSRAMLLGSLALSMTLAVSLLFPSGTAGAANETTTTTTESSTTTTTSDSTTTTTEPSSTTTTTAESSTTTTTAESSTTTTVSSTTSTTQPSTTTTTSPDSAAGSDPPDTDSEVDDFRVGTRPAPPIVFPIVGDYTFRDTFGAPRDGGRRRHAGADIFADKLVPVVAVADGVVEEVSEGRLAGQYVIVRHDNGWRSKYLHLNNDTRGTDNGLALGYADGIEVGVRVRAGMVIGFVGDSGNAENTAPHLHFALHQPNGLPINPHRALRRAPVVEVPYTLSGRAYSDATLDVDTFNTELVGHIDPDGAGMNAGLAMAGDHVYMGTSGQNAACPGTGVRVIDVSNPAKPDKVAVLAGADEFADTAATTVWAGAVETPEFVGDLAVVGLSLCGDSDWARASADFAGFALYDVRNPARPTLLSTVHSGEETLGVSHLDVLSEDGRLLVAATVPESHLHDLEERGDVRFYDATDPLRVVEVSDWDLRRNGPPLLVEALRARGGDSALATRGVTWLDGETVAVAHSAAGLVTIDVSELDEPGHVGTASAFDTYDLVFDARAVEDYRNEAHGGWVHDGWLLVQDNAGLQPPGAESGDWGQQTFYDLKDPDAPRLLSTFGTERSQSGIDGEVSRDGFYSARRSAPFKDDLEIVAWSSDGVRLVDIGDPTNPAEVAFFVPMARSDPQGRVRAPDGTRAFPMVWDVVSDEKLVYASDVNSGLWIFRVLPIPSIGNDPVLE
ncbi:MAG: peptidoglycan DD-metalloendopeptidase family protein [Actinomycetota bacterium]